MSVILGIATAIFIFGFLIGLAVFSQSKAPVAKALFCGIAAVVATVTILYAGCAIMLGGLKY